MPYLLLGVGLLAAEQPIKQIRLTCEFSTLPHRTTFNRFINRLALHRDLVEECMATLTDQLAELLPGLGQNIAVDSTVVKSHSSPKRKTVSDPEASWTAKNSARSKSGKEWHWGYKYHLVADATYGVPLYGYTTTASRNDSPELPKLLSQAEAAHPWLHPTHVMADKGYDSRANHEAVAGRDAILVCPARRYVGRTLYEGIYTERGIPTCIGMVPMEYVRTETEKGHLYRCALGGCRLKGRKGVRYCDDETWVNRTDNPRLFGPIRQGSPEWKGLYRLRQSVERVFKSMKESRRLERHFKRGLQGVSLHASMSALSFAATFHQNLRVGREPRWMVRRVA